MRTAIGVAVASVLLLACGDNTTTPSSSAAGIEQSPSFQVLVPCNFSVTFLSADNPVPAHTGGHTARFSVKNLAGSTSTTSLSCTGSRSITCDGVDPSSVTLAPGASQTVLADFSAGAHGFGYVTVSTCSSSATSTKIIVN
jgi:hypothetical protein